MLLVDRWEALQQAHQLIQDVEHDSWPRFTCWTRYLTRCSCGDSYPVYAVTDAEIRNDAHISSAVRTHRQLHHLKHLVSVLLDEAEGQAEDVEDPTALRGPDAATGGGPG